MVRIDENHNKKLTTSPGGYSGPLEIILVPLTVMPFIMRATVIEVISHLPE